MSITRREAFSIALARKLLTHYEATPLHLDMRSVLDKIAESLEGDITIEADWLSEHVGVLPEDRVRIDPDVWAQLAGFVERREAIQATYQTFDGRVSEYELHPCHLLAYHGNWYVLARHVAKDKIGSFALSRFRQIEATGQTFARPRDFSPETYARHAFGIVGGEDPMKVRLLTLGWRLIFLGPINERKLMFKGRILQHIAISGFAVGVVVGLYLATAKLPFVSTTHAQETQKPQPKSSPVKALTVQDAYYPGTEDLAPDEMRVTACGTGMPMARPKQAAACWLVEVGNGDKFIFHIGSGSAERLSALAIPWDYLDKVFIGHLHSDHFCGFGDLWVGVVVSNRQRPLRVWGPSGSKPEYGTKYAVEKMQEMLIWDAASRIGNVNTKGLKIELHEFDYKGINPFIY